MWSAATSLAIGLTVAAAGVLLLARALHFASTGLPPALDRAIGWLMHAQLMAFMNTFRHWRGLAAGGLALLLLLAGAPRWCAREEAGRWRLRGGFRLAAAVALLLGNVLLDESPYLALWCWLTLPLALLAPRLLTRVGGRRALAWLAGVALAGPVIAMAPSWVDGVCLGLWAVLLALVARGLSRRLPAFEMAIVLVAALALVQLAAVHAPLLWAGGGGRELGPGHAYSFCELPGGSRVLAVVPACDANVSLEECIRGHVSEYDAETGNELARYQPFSRAFYGRALHLLCLDDRVQIGMAQTVIRGRYQREAVIELDRRANAPVRKELLGGAVGHRMAFDPAGDAVFYVSEWSGAVYRWDRARNVVRRDIGRVLSDTATGEVSADEQIRHSAASVITSLPLSLQTEIAAVHERRGSVFFAEWLSGSRVFEVDTTTLRLRRVLRTDNGANHSLAVDEERDRLIVSGLWGVEVIDLESGAVVARRRLGAGPRLPVIDRIHGLVYVPTTFGGGVWVLDRDRYRCRGRLDVGNGGRNAMLSSDGRFLYASSGRAHYRWETAALAQRFGR